MKKRIITVLLAIALIIFASIGIANVRTSHQHIQLDEIKLQDNTAKLKILNTKYIELNTQLDKTGADKAKLEQQLKSLEEEKAKLQADLLAKKLNTPKISAVAYAAPAPAVSGCGDNQYANFIYMKESGCRTGAVNSIGCRGIGQACPGTKLPCGDDYVCQNAFFTSYAISRYGSWEAAYNFWIGHHWW